VPQVSEGLQFDGVAAEHEDAFAASLRAAPKFDSREEKQTAERAGATYVNAREQVEATAAEIRASLLSPDATSTDVKSGLVTHDRAGERDARAEADARSARRGALEGAGMALDVVAGELEAYRARDREEAALAVLDDAELDDPAALEAWATLSAETKLALVESGEFAEWEAQQLEYASRSMEDFDSEVATVQEAREHVAENIKQNTATVSIWQKDLGLSRDETIAKLESIVRFATDRTGVDPQTWPPEEFRSLLYGAHASAELHESAERVRQFKQSLVDTPTSVNEGYEMVNPLTGQYQRVGRAIIEAQPVTSADLDRATVRHRPAPTDEEIKAAIIGADADTAVAGGLTRGGKKFSPESLAWRNERAFADY
jgi:hypothetical protein